MNINELKKYELIVITCYHNPDLDGFACVYGYSDLLKKLGINAVAAISGSPSLEAEYVIKKAKADDYEDARKIIDKADAIILVDASDTAGIDERIKPSKVVQVIDNRMHNEAEAFKNAHIEIEVVGATSTMIAEKFIERGIIPSDSSGILLQTGIVSNTINFRNKITTHRDRRTSDWIKSQVEIPQDIVEKMFKAKSVFRDESLYHVIENNLALYKFKRAMTGLAQLEIIDASKFVDKNSADILRDLRKLAIKYEAKYMILSVIDVNTAQNIFIVSNEESEKLLKETLNLEFEEGICFSDGIIMRKELVPMLHAHIEGIAFDINDIRPKDFNFFSRHHHEDEVLDEAIEEPKTE